MLFDEQSAIGGNLYTQTGFPSNAANVNANV